MCSSIRTDDGHQKSLCVAHSCALLAILESLAQSDGGTEMRPAGVREPRLVNPECVAAPEDHRSLDDVLQLANVARPFVGLAQLQGLLVDLADLFSRLGRCNR